MGLDCIVFSSGVIVIMVRRHSNLLDFTLIVNNSVADITRHLFIFDFFVGCTHAYDSTLVHFSATLPVINGNDIL